MEPIEYVECNIDQEIEASPEPDTTIVEDEIVGCGICVTCVNC